MWGGEYREEGQPQSATLPRHKALLSGIARPSSSRYVRLGTHRELRRTKYHQQWWLCLSIESDIPSLLHPLIVISEHSPIPGLSPS